jgi:hypothetical protein
VKWFIPSWNGDLRLEPAPSDTKGATVLSIFDPTPAEREIVKRILARCVDEKWVSPGERDDIISREALSEKRVTIAAPLEKVGPVVAKIMRPGAAVLTAIRFKDGRVETTSGEEAELLEVAAAAALAPPEKKAEAAATVKRPTPCCPDCIADSVKPAREALLAFLTPEQHETWAAERYIVVEGGLSGNRYRLAHRHTRLAAQQQRICWDLDDDLCVHFHDWTVPPEEEVLAAKLILEHREPWLRNEATHFCSGRALCFKNPFGDGGDGVADSSFTSQIGHVLSGKPIGHILSSY